MPNWPISACASLLGVLGGELVEKGLGAGAGDGAEARGQVVAGHADAVVGDGQGLGVLVERDGDGEGRAVGDELGLGDRLVAQLLAGVGGVGDEFADEDLPVGIDRMNHQMQQARNVGLEALRRRGFGGRGLWRRRSKRASLQKLDKWEPHAAACVDIVALWVRNQVAPVIGVEIGVSRLQGSSRSPGSAHFWA